jgi:hypothetical protein
MPIPYALAVSAIPKAVPITGTVFKPVFNKGLINPLDFKVFEGVGTFSKPLAASCNNLLSANLVSLSTFMITVNLLLFYP